MTQGNRPLEGHILLSRIAVLERRVQSLAESVVFLRDAAKGSIPEIRSDLRIEPDHQPWVGQGFHRPERDDAGRLFCWAGEEEYFEFRFFLDRRSARPFRLYGGFASGVDREMLRATIDYRPIRINLEESGDRAEITGAVPPDAIARGATLTFYCPTVSVGSNGDSRRLSFAFSRLDIGMRAEAPKHRRRTFQRAAAAEHDFRGPGAPTRARAVADPPPSGGSALPPALDPNDLVPVRRGARSGPCRTLART